MRRNVAGLVVVFVGAAIVQLAISNTYLRYVKPGMRWMLLAAGVILILLAVADVLADTRRKPAQQHDDGQHDDGQHDHEPHTGDDDGHGHHGLPRAAWLLLIPVFALLVVDPPALGADAAQRQSPVAAKPVAPKNQSWLADSAQSDKPVPLAVRDYAIWAVWEKDSMKGRNFQLTGFVTPGKNGSWYVSRIGLTCCVADGTAFMVEARGDQPAPAKNQWVTVTGEWAEPTKRQDGDVAAITITEVRQVTPPTNQYE
ncbi:TIGR03943 family putative permease subunit [Kribbella caucasensis]|uniref:TIGR03943 family putative permease subunit n=1 Tax=Kribbella caucasensis TaxID=2512215 RepID=UPI001EE0C5E4|nr:TIGR03943 family protein [Kribbella sp. VKM Ac-2527]